MGYKEILTAHALAFGWAVGILVFVFGIYGIMHFIFKRKYFKERYVWLKGLDEDTWIRGRDLKRSLIRLNGCEEQAKYFEIGFDMRQDLSDLEDEGLVERKVFKSPDPSNEEPIHEFRLTPAGLEKKLELNPH